MKKVLLSFVTLAAVTAAQAAPLQPTRLPEANDARFNSVRLEQPASALKAPALAESRTTLSVNYSPAYDPYTAIGIKTAKKGDVMTPAIQFTKANTNTFAGNKVTAINFYTGINTQTGNNTITSATAYLTYDLEKGTPFASKTVSCPTTQATPVSAVLDEPYTIEADKPFYVCVAWTLNASTDYVFVIDFMNHGSDVSGGWVGIKLGDDAPVWDNFATSYGFNCIGVTIEGDKMPQNEVAAPAMATNPVVYANQGFDAQVLIHNTGANDVNNIDLSLKVGNLPVQTENFTFQTPIAYNQEVVLTLPGITYPTGGNDPIDITFSVDKVNGVANASTTPSTSTSVLVVPEGKGYIRNVVFEELTGNWCGWCPTGIAMIDYMTENYDGEGFIPVAIHVNPDGGREPMYVASYNAVASMGSGGVPKVLVNRSEELSPWPLNNVIAAFEAYHAMPAIAEINIDAHFSVSNPKLLHISAQTAFTFDADNANELYGISFGITEDGYGPYNQQNYYSGESGDYGGWEKKGSSVSTIYNDVARQLVGFTSTQIGLDGDIPSSVTAGKEYTFDYDLTLNSNVKNLDKINLVAYLINKKTGAIENAAFMRTAALKAGVEDAATDTVDPNAPVEYYNLQGVRVAEPAAGNLYIRRQGNQATKVIF